MSFPPPNSFPGKHTRSCFSMTVHSLTLAASWKAMAFVALLFAWLPAQVDAQAVIDQEPDAVKDANLKQAVDNLASIQQSIESKRSVIRDFREQIKQLEDTSDKQALEQKIERIKNEITNLQQSFEHITLNGVNLSVLTEQPEQRIKWQDEIEQISRPLLSTLKELTEKPRQIDSLNREIERRENQLKVIQKAVDSLQVFKAQALVPAVVAPINDLLVDWQQRKADTQRALDIAHFKLTNLETESATWQATTGEAITEFFLGRGLTLLLAAILSLAIWLLSKGLLKLYWQWVYRTRHDIGVSHAPLVLYSYRLAVAIIIVLGILIVFYVRGDVLLITLAVIVLAGVALSLRQTLPRYTAEVRLLLGVGPVREQERLVLDDIPFMVESLSLFSVLRNPALEGVVRLPLHAMNEHKSRPAGDEPWFPCQPGDYVLLANGSLGRVLRQTIELVEVAVMESVVQVRTTDFLTQNVRNLSRGKFGIASTFGIDYQHQEICLDTVPARFREAIFARFEQLGMRDDVEDIMVELKAAGASSLDYQIYVVLNGRAASMYFKAQRLVQRACVDTCNREGWIIPFTQVTVHNSQEVTEPEQEKERNGTAIPS